MKIPVRSHKVSHVIMNPQPFRKITDDEKFVIVAQDLRDKHRSVELHLTEKEIHKLQLDMNEYLDEHPTITRIVSYD